jgi:gluconolactonase
MKRTHLLTRNSLGQNQAARKITVAVGLLIASFAFGEVCLQAADSVVATDAKLNVEGRVAFTEGPAWHSSGNVYFTDIVNNRIMRRDPAGQLHVFRTPSGRANGLWFDKQFRLHACEGGGEGGNRRVTRTELNGTITVLADEFEGKRLNSPNDLTIDSKGRVFFSDPRYGDRGDAEQFDSAGKSVEGVYRIDPDGAIHRVISHEVARPNGLGISPDGKYLFVADNLNDGPENGVGGARRLWRFSFAGSGELDLSSRLLLFDWGTDRGPDGLSVAADGRIFAAAGFNHPSLPAETVEKYRAGIYVIDPSGNGLLQTIPVPADMITNCTFGGEDGRTLFITAGHKLWSIRLNVAGK